MKTITELVQSLTGAFFKQKYVAPIENGTTPSKSYAAGDLLMHNNVLYKALTALTTSTTLVPNLNIQETTVLDVPKMNTDGSNAASSVIFNNALTVGSRKSGSTVGTKSVAIGTSVIAKGGNSYAQGNVVQALNSSDHAEGDYTIAKGGYSHAEGAMSYAFGSASHAEGYADDWNNMVFRAASQNASEITTSVAHNDLIGRYIEVYVGDTNDTRLFGFFLDATTFRLVSPNKLPFAISDYTEYEYLEPNLTMQDGGHAEGYKAQALGDGSHAEGGYTTAKGGYSHAEGEYTFAEGSNSHAEGSNTKSSGAASHAEGYKSKATLSYAHAEGRETTANGQYSHSEGYNTTASGSDSHAEGNTTIAQGNHSHAGGSNATALLQDQFVQGGATAKFVGSAMAVNGSALFGISPNPVNYTEDTTVTNGYNGCSGTVGGTNTVTIDLAVQGLYLIATSVFTISTGVCAGVMLKLIGASGISTGQPLPPYNIYAETNGTASPTVTPAVNNQIKIKNTAATTISQFHLIRIL